MAELSVVINSSGAKQGANEVLNALNSVQQSASSVDKTLKDFALNTTKSMDDIKSKTIDLSGAFVKMAAAFAIYEIKKMVQDTALMAARYETMGVVMSQVGKAAGYTSAQMIGFEKSLEKSGISMIESRESLARLVQAHVDLSNSSKLARIAQDSAVIGNMNSSQAFQSLVYGIQSANVHVLRTIGINVNFEQSYKKLADQIGKTSTDLTDQEKAQARLNAVYTAGEAIVGTYEAAMGTAGKQITSFSRYVDDFKVKMGEAFQPSLVDLVKAATKAMQEMQDQISRADVQSSLKNISNDLSNIIIKAGKDLPGAIVATSSALSAIKSIYSSIPGEVLLGGGFIGSILFGKWGWAISAMLADIIPKVVAAKTAISNLIGSIQPGSGPVVIRMKVPDQPLTDSWASRANETAAANARATKAIEDMRTSQIPSSGGSGKIDKSAFNDAKAALRDYQRAIDDIKDSFDQETMNKFDYERSKVNSYYQTQLGLLRGKTTTELEAVKASRLSNIDIEQSSERMNLTGGNPLANASQSIDSLNASRLQAETDLTAKINQLTMNEHDYKLWALDDEYQKAKESAKEKGIDTESYMAKLTQYYDLQKSKANETSTWLIKLSDTTAQAMEKDLSTFFFDVITGKLNSFQSFATSVFQSVAKIASDYMGQVAKEVMFGPAGASAGSGSVGGLLGNLVGWISGSSSGATTLSNGAIVNPSGVVTKMHSGGVVGQDYSGLQHVPMSLFDGAPRFHDGLYPDEFPAILQRGEIVIPKNATSGTQAVSAPSRQPNVTVNVHNNTGVQAGVKQDVKWNGQEMVVNLWMDAVSRNVNGVRDFMGG